MSYSNFAEYLSTHPDHSSKFAEMVTHEITASSSHIEPNIFHDTVHNRSYTIMPKSASIMIKFRFANENRVRETLGLEPRYVPACQSSDAVQNSSEHYFFVRNPYDRYISALKFFWIGSELIADGTLTPRSADHTETHAYNTYSDWRNWGSIPSDPYQAHWMPQSWFLPSTGTYTDPNDWVTNLSVDVSSENVHYIKYEDFEYIDDALALLGVDFIGESYSGYDSSKYTHDRTKSFNVSDPNNVIDMSQVNTTLVSEITARDVEIYNTLPSFSG